MSSNRGPQTVRHVGRGGSPSIVGELVTFTLTVALEAVRFAFVVLIMVVKLCAWVTRAVVLPALQVCARALQRWATVTAARVEMRRALYREQRGGRQ